MGGGEVIKKGWLIKSPPLDGGGGIKKVRRLIQCGGTQSSETMTTRDIYAVGSLKQ